MGENWIDETKNWVNAQQFKQIILKFYFYFEWQQCKISSSFAYPFASFDNSGYKK